jgi:hypothetical protein
MAEPVVASKAQMASTATVEVRFLSPGLRLARAALPAALAATSTHWQTPGPGPGGPSPSFKLAKLATVDSAGSTRSPNGLSVSPGHWQAGGPRRRPGRAATKLNLSG